MSHITCPLQRELDLSEIFKQAAMESICTGYAFLMMIVFNFILANTEIHMECG